MARITRISRFAFLCYQQGTRGRRPFGRKSEEAKGALDAIKIRRECCPKKTFPVVLEMVRCSATSKSFVRPAIGHAFSEG